MKVMNQFAEGMNLDDILIFTNRFRFFINSRKQNELIVKKHLKIVDGLAICIYLKPELGQMDIGNCYQVQRHSLLRYSWIL